MPELGMALLALALAGGIAAGEVRKYRHRMRRDACIAELRNFAVAFETYRVQRGEWPAATNPEVRVPRGMESALAGTAWATEPALGGSYDWIPPAKPKTETKDAASSGAPDGMIAITAFAPGEPLALSEEDLRYIDSKLDDGNLATGRFRTGFNRWPVYLVNVRR